jgi:hypothetical protein
MAYLIDCSRGGLKGQRVLQMSTTDTDDAATLPCVLVVITGYGTSKDRCLAETFREYRSNLSQPQRRT